MLTLDQTNNVKGVLLTLIIIGHIEQFFSGGNESYQMLLYSFHVSSFFFLPFLFNNDTLTYGNLIKNTKRLYIPYSIFFVLVAIMFHFIMKHNSDFISIIAAFLIGSAALLKDVIGIRAYWFFPAFFSTLLLLMLFNTLTYKMKNIFILLFIVSHFLIPTIPGDILTFFPLALYVPLYLFILGLIIKYISENWQWQNYPRYTYILALAALLSYSFDSRFNIASPLLPNPLIDFKMFFTHDLIMILGFFSVAKISQDWHIFNFIGKYSLAFYTIHPLVIQLVNKTHHWSSISDAVIKFVLVLFITFIAVKTIYYININKYIYPR
jgi:fucose 4-O-acetylase-like acetyltransferase